MKKIFTSLVLLLMAITMSAAETVVGEDNYAPAGQSFTWNFNIDFQTQKFTASIDLTGCNADNTNENVFSVGTDINAYFSNKQMAGNIHFYYTPSTKTLSCQYISSNASYGAYKYITALSDVEGTVTIDLSQEYGLKVNDSQVFNAAQLTKLLTWSTLQCGSNEGSTRSNATVLKARVEDTSFHGESTECTAAAKLLFDGAYSRFDEVTWGYTTKSLSKCDLLVEDVTVNGKLLGDIDFVDVNYENMESYGNNTPGYVMLSFNDAAAVLSNVGEFGEELGLKANQTLNIDTAYVYFYGSDLYVEMTLDLNGKKLAYTFNVSDPTSTTFTSTLTTKLNDDEYSAEDQTMQVSDYGDGFADITINNIQFQSLTGIELGALTIKEVPYTYNDAGEQTFSVTGFNASLESPSFEQFRNLSGVSVEGKVSGEEAYFEVSASLAGYNASIVFGEPIAPYVVYKGAQAVYNGDGTTDEKEEGSIAVRDEGDGKYTIVLTDVAGENSLSFEAEGTTDENGMITYTAESAAAPMHAEYWEGYYAYITISEAKSWNGRFYGVFDIDRGGYAAYGYSDYGHTLTFGEDFDPTAINIVKGEISNQPVQIYNVNGARMNAMQRGVNIVRTADGKTMKVVKK